MKLYKYCRINQWLYENLINGTLWFAKPKTFNDPFDCNNPVNIGATEFGISKFYDTIIQSGRKYLLLNLDRESFIKQWKLNPVEIEMKVKAEIDKENQKIGILSLSETATSISMWAHYSDSHKGVCFEFDLEAGDIFTGKEYLKVNYPPDDHYFNPFDENAPPKDSVLGLMITKSEEWVRENEIRVIHKEEGFVEFNKDTLTKIIFGYYASDYQINTIIKLSRNTGYKNILFDKIDLHHNEYKLIQKTILI